MRFVENIIYSTIVNIFTQLLDIYMVVLYSIKLFTNLFYKLRVKNLHEAQNRTDGYNK